MRKKPVYLVTFFERRTICIVGWCVTSERDPVTLQALLDDSLPAVWYDSDLFATYQALLYTPGVHTPMPNKSQTFRVEGMNAELRHYLKRLARRTRAVSKCLHGLFLAIKRFVFAGNRRQL